MWEGILNKWADEIPSWVACPTDASPNAAWQQVMSMWSRLTRGGGLASETDDELLCPYHWAAPIHSLNCEIVWPKALDEPPYRHTAPHAPAHDSTSSHDCSGYDLNSSEAEFADGPGPYLELDTPGYAGVISERLIVEKLLAQAGIRLAAILNWLFADLDGEGSRYAKLGVTEPR
jgi:hypothetical protein